MLLLLIIVIVVATVFLILFLKPKNPHNTHWSEWFSQRDLLPQSTLPVDQWYVDNWNNGWGPEPALYSIPIEPSPNIIEIARHYIGLPYRHHHIPGWNPSSSLTGKPNESPGLDCSNFTSWVYNYGKGHKFTSNIQKQAEMYKYELAMIRIDWNMIQPEDLLFFWRIPGNQEKEISHSGIFSGYKNNIPYLIDSHGEGVKERAMTPNTWYRKHFSHGIRISS